MDANFYDIVDLNVGNEVEFFGRVFKITDCDRFTRNFLNRCGIAVPDPINTPVDPYLEHRSHESDTMLPRKPRKKIDTLGQFLANDRKVNCCVETYFSSDLYLLLRSYVSMVIGMIRKRISDTYTIWRYIIILQMIQLTLKKTS